VPHVTPACYRRGDRCATTTHDGPSGVRDDEVMHESQQVRAEYLAILVSVLDDGIADGSF
jgi:hypothetical protein